MDQLTFEQLPSAFASLYNKVENIERLLLQEHKLPPETDSFYTIKQAAEFLKLSVPTLYGLVSKSNLPVNKRGKRLYFSKEELIKWIKEGKKKSPADLAREVDQYLTGKSK